MRSPTAPLIAWSRVFMASPPQIGEARRFLAAIMDGSPCADDALLCLSELATNAMLHSRSRQPGGIFTVRAQRYGYHLRVEVCDQGGPWRPSALTGPDRQSGRGLVIVDQLARAWGRSGDEAGRTVWFEIGAGPAQRWITLLDGQQLRLLRRYHGLTQQELAAKAGISCATVTRLERASPLACHGRTLSRLAGALGIEPAVLMAHPVRPAPGPATGSSPGGLPNLATSLPRSPVQSGLSPPRQGRDPPCGGIRCGEAGGRGQPRNVRADRAGAGRAGSGSGG